MPLHLMAEAASALLELHEHRLGQLKPLDDGGGEVNKQEEKKGSEE